MNEIKVALLQCPLHWEDAEANRKAFESRFQKLEEVDIVFLPEMFSTGFSMNPQKLAETMNGPTLKWMKTWSERLNCVLTGSLIIQENQEYFNRLIWMEPDGRVRHYDKRHRFSYAGEHKEYTAGTERPTWEWKGWRIRPQVCYDLRFPVWSRNDDDYDLLYYVANWPERRNHPWKSLLTARAIENMAYVVGLNRVGEDGNGVTHSGDSRVLDSVGEIVAEAKPSEEEVVYASLSKEHLKSTRERFQFLADRDDFEIKV